MEEIKYRLVRSNRRTLVIQIGSYGEVVVRAPARAPTARIEDFIRAKKDWIFRTVERQNRKSGAVGFSFLDGGRVKIFGNDYEVRICDGKGRLEGNLVYLTKDAEKQSFSDLAIDVLRNYLAIRVPAIAHTNGFGYSKVSVTSATTRWGSCGRLNTLNFSRALACLPLFAVDYVIVHELCHTRVRNHSSAFYAEVKKIMPDYRQAEKILKENSFVSKIFD